MNQGEIRCRKRWLCPLCHHNELIVNERVEKHSLPIYLKYFEIALEYERKTDFFIFHRCLLLFSMRLYITHCSLPPFSMTLPYKIRLTAKQCDLCGVCCFILTHYVQSSPSWEQCYKTFKSSPQTTLFDTSTSIM